MKTVARTAGGLAKI